MDGWVRVTPIWWLSNGRLSWWAYSLSSGVGKEMQITIDKKVQETAVCLSVRLRESREEIVPDKRYVSIILWSR